MEIAGSIFQDILRPELILSEPADLQYYGADTCKQFPAAPKLILLPESEKQVQSIVSRAREHKIALVPSGGRTGMSGGCTASQGEVVVSLSRMNRILDLNVFDQTLRCEAGAVTETVRERARQQGLFYPPDFASKGSSQIGGNVATNAGGIRVIRYGGTRDWVLGVRVVTGRGEILDLNGPLYKNQTGYDLRGLVIGAEGTLGIVTEVTLRLTTPPIESVLALCALKHRDSVLDVMRQIRSAGFVLTLFEYFEQNALDLVVRVQNLKRPFLDRHECYALIEVERPRIEDRERFQDVLARLIEGQLLDDVVVAENSQQYEHLLALRERISESIAKAYLPHKNDISVPVSSMTKFLQAFRDLLAAESQRYESIAFGHVGDGNIHLNILKPEAMSSAEFFAACHALDQKVFALVRKFAGSVSAEHGVGLLKKEYLSYSRSPLELEMMRSIKRIFDPGGIMNPGKIF